MGALVAFVLAIMPIAATAVAAIAGEGREYRVAVVPLVALLATALSLCGIFVAVAVAVRLRCAAVDDRPRGIALAVVAIPMSMLTTLWGALLTLITTVSFSRGRQLRERGRPLFAPLVSGDSWLDDVARVDAPPAVAAAWRENGKTEHASVIAFHKLAAELIALKAPAHLVDDARRDGRDEARHTRLCFSLARAVDGQSLEPGALFIHKATSITRTARLVKLAVESLIDGALNEGTSARVVARLSKRTEVHAVRDVLRQIAADEGRHASHGWDVLAWCLHEGGPVVMAAVDGALWALPTSMGTSRDRPGDDGALEPWGIPGRALLDECYAEVRAAVVDKARAMRGRPRT